MLKNISDDGQVVIEDDCLIGVWAILLKELKIGRGSIIEADSVVVKDVPAYSIYTGVPTSRTRHRRDVEPTIKHEKIKSERRLPNEY